MSVFNYELIDQYLAGELSGEALAAFEKEMKDNPALAREVELYKSIEQDMKQQVQHEEGEKKLRSSLQQLNGEFFTKPKAKLVPFKKYLLAVAAAAAAIAAFFLLQPGAKEAFDNNKLYAYYTKDAATLSPGQRGGPTDSLLTAAAKLYNNKEYKAALPLLRQVVAQKPDDTEVFIAIGYCYMQTDSSSAAAEVFDQVINGTSVYRNQALWYKSLLLLKQNKVDDCYAVLKLIPDGADKYKEVKEMMKKIEKR